MNMIPNTKYFFTVFFFLLTIGLQSQSKSTDVEKTVYPPYVNQLGITWVRASDLFATVPMTILLLKLLIPLLQRLFLRGRC